MKYYAVTDDPNELMHYGIKGMKWGVIRTDAQLGHPKKPTKPRSTKPKSDAYISASSKLRKMMASGIQKAQASWKEYNSPENKAIRDYKRGERLFEKHVQLARQGRLKYKGISDEEVMRITDRLALENIARNQSGKENPSFVRRLTSKLGDGIIEGVGRGASSYINERMQGRGRTTAEIKGARRKTRAEFTPLGRINQAIENNNEKRRARREAKREIDKEFYKTAAERGESLSKVGKAANIAVLGVRERNDMNKVLLNKTMTDAEKEIELQKIRRKYRGLRSKEAMGFTRESRARRVQAERRISQTKNDLYELNKERDKRISSAYGAAMGKYYSDLEQERLNRLYGRASTTMPSPKTSGGAPSTGAAKPSTPAPKPRHTPKRKRSGYRRTYAYRRTP